MDSAEISLLVRGTDGQIKFVSEGLGIPQFYNLVRSKEGNRQVLLDFSPVIEALHGIHKQAHNERILTKYNTMYNYWLDAKTYTKEPLKAIKSEELVKQSSALINELHIVMQKADVDLSSVNSILDSVLSIKKDCDIYIDSMLCLVYAKALQDLASFKGDVVVGGYATFLVDRVERLYRLVLNWGRNFDDSFLKFIAFEQPNELQAYLALESDERAESFRLRCLEEAKPQYDEIKLWDERYTTIRQVKIQYDAYHTHHVRAGHELRDLLQRARSLKRLVDRLKEGNVEWESGEDAMNALAQEIHIEQRGHPRLR